jgi:para-aminobenzoate synthetase component 1
MPFAWRDPFAVFAPAALRSGAAMLIGGEYAFLGLSPTQLISSGFADLQAVLTKRQSAASIPFGPFGCGGMGYLGYELGGQVESLPEPCANGPTLPDMLVGFFDAVAVFHLPTKTAAVLAVGDPAMEDQKWSHLAHQRAQACMDEIHAAPDTLPTESWGATQWTADWTQEDYESRIRRTLEYIRAGDIFQANIAQRLTAPRPFGMSAFGLFRKLCRNNPAPFAAYFAVDAERAVVSSSPERFLRIDVVDGVRHVETRPIKGTRPRSTDPVKDRTLAEELCHSIKDRAENLMIVDLLRNDLSRTAKVGSVQVPELWQIESYATVHHLVSAVTSEPQDSIASLEVLRQAFPGGSITGAPKIRAMEIIHELEAMRRGAYCGGFGWFGDNGAMDTAIGIRTMLVDGDTLSVSAGGGIVSDSVPADEYRETLVKAAAMLRTVEPNPAILQSVGL